jgi:hypothetical protein
MSTLTKEIVLTRTTAYWPTFNQMSYDYDHFYRIAEREGIQVVIDSKPSLELAADFQPSEVKNLISINANGHIPEGDSLVCTYAKLFNYYYRNKSCFRNFRCRLPPEGEEYAKLCLAAGFLAAVPSRLLIEDLRMRIDPGMKYRFSHPFATRRVRLVLNHLTQLKERNNRKALRKLSGADGLALCENYLKKLQRAARNPETST